MLHKTLALLAVLTVSAPQDPKPRLNVLFVAVDDLRPQLGCYGDRIVKSPNVDALAARGLVFDKAYCQQAVCSPSRSSLLTGRRPDATKVYDLETHFRKALPDVTTLPEHFKKHGYHAQGFGKIYHGGFDDAPSWSVPHTNPKKPGYGPAGQALQKKLNDEARAKGLDLTKRQNQPRGPSYEAPDVEDGALSDGSIADLAIEALRALKDRPFFLAVGFLKPHLPFVAPKKYWDLYREDEFKLAANPNPPEGAPKFHPHTSGELRAYHGVPKEGPVPDDLARKLIHGYYACMSYMDAQLGRVLAEVDRLGLRDRTVVVLWGDHGWQLGEHGMWCKHTNYETSTRAPLLIAVPGQKSPGRTSKGLVEFVDVYPSLVELCALPMPEGLEGTSFVPLLDDPGRAWKKAAFSQYPRGVPGVGRCMGYTIRTDRWRLVAWEAAEKQFAQYELYDHENDPGENVNLAGRPEHAATLKQLTELLKGGWRGAVPAR